MLDFDPAKLRYIRKKLNLTQSQFARQAGVSQSLIAKVEAGRLDPTYSKVRKMAEALERLSHQEEKEAGQIMTKDVVISKPNESLKELVALMSKRNISQVPVMDMHRVIGLVTEGGLLEAQIRKSIAELKVKEVMSEPPPIVAPTAPVSAVMGLLRYFPAVLVAKDGTVEGIITKSDLIKATML